MSVREDVAACRRRCSSCCPRPSAAVDAVRAAARRAAFHRGLDLAAHGHGVAARLLVNDDQGRRLALVGASLRRSVWLPSDTLGHVAQADLFARRRWSRTTMSPNCRGRGDLRRHGHRIGVGRAVGQRARPRTARRGRCRPASRWRPSPRRNRRCRSISARRAAATPAWRTRPAPMIETLPTPSIFSSSF